MIFKVREGFVLHNSPDAGAHYLLGGLNRANATPRARAGQMAKLTLEEVNLFRQRGMLGALEPIDAEAKAVYGDTAPKVAAHIANPLLTIPSEAAA